MSSDSGLAENTDSESEESRSSERRARIARVLLTCGALVVLSLYLAVPDLDLDALALVLLGIAVIPWLGEVFESVDTPFGGVKYRRLSERVDRLTGESSSLRKVQEANEARDRVPPDEFSSQMSATDRLAELAEQYTEVRDPEKGMRSGADRTAVMTRLVGQMIAAADAGATLPLENALRGSDLGRRLAGYAVLYARPDPAFAIPLVESVIELEPKPFGQFWGLRAIGRLIESAGPEAIDLNTARRLKDFRRTLSPASDRMVELRRILQQLGLR